MASVFHRFCGVTVETSAPCPIPEDAQGALFRTDDRNPLLRFSLEPVDRIPTPPGDFCGRAGEKQVWRQDHSVTRLTWDRFRPAPHIALSYDPQCPGEARALVRRDDWAWAAGTKYLWTGLALNQQMLALRTLFFHASYVACDGFGILFTAPSGTGKSTQAELWRTHRNARVINGDKAAVSLREAPMIHSIPFSGTSGICQNCSLPLKAVVVLSQAPENSLRPMSPSEIVTALCPNVFVDQLVPEEWSRALNLLLDLALAVPVYHLACTPDIRAVETLEQALYPERK